MVKLLPIKGEIEVGSRVVHKDIPVFNWFIKSNKDGIAMFNTGQKKEEYFIKDLILVSMCAVETNFKAPIKAIAITNHAFVKWGEEYQLKEEKERGKDNSVVIVKGFEKVGDFYEKAKADDLRKPLWIKKDVFGLNLGEISGKAKWVTDGMMIKIKTKKSILGSIEPKKTKDGKIRVMCDNCTSYH